MLVVPRETLPHTIEGRFCALGQFTEEYHPTMQEYLVDPEVIQYIPELGKYTPDDVAKGLSLLAHSQCLYAVFTKGAIERPVCVGVTSLRLMDATRGIAISGTIIGAKTYWGLGIAYEAKRLHLSVGFGLLNLKMVYAAIHRDNVRSQRLVRRLGYERSAKVPEFDTPLLSGPPREWYGLTYETWLATCYREAVAGTQMREPQE